MKSIMEEASTVTKAIETAWNRAGQPQEFTIKILELPKTSFFGLKTAKSAKIAFFFNEQTVKIKETAKPTRPQQPQLRQTQEKPAHTGDMRPQQQRRPLSQAPQQTQRPERAMPEARQQHTRPEHKPHHAQRPGPERHSQRPQAPRDQQPQPHRQPEQRETWAPEMVDAARDWLKETLVLMGKPDITIDAQVSHNYLKFVLNKPVMDDTRQEETQLKSWGSLAMEAVREKTHKPLRSLRIILESKK